MPAKTNISRKFKLARGRATDIPKKRVPFGDPFWNASKMGELKSRSLCGLQFLFLILFDLNRDIPSDKLRRKRHSDFKDPMLIPGGNLVSLYALR